MKLSEAAQKGLNLGVSHISYTFGELDALGEPCGCFLGIAYCGLKNDKMAIGEEDSYDAFTVMDILIEAWPWLSKKWFNKVFGLNYMDKLVRMNDSEQMTFEAIKAEVERMERELVEC